MLESLEVFDLYHTATCHGLDDTLRLIRLAKKVMVRADGSLWAFVPVRTRN